MSNTLYLGMLKDDAGTYADGEALWLTKHEWSCGWYWSLGYVGNKNCHFHFNDLLCIKTADGSVKYCASDLFKTTNISDKEWWVIRDLFVQAYALQKAAEVYRYGGHQTTVEGVTDTVKSEDMAAKLNADLARVLDVLWVFVEQAVKPKGETK